MPSSLSIGPLRTFGENWIRIYAYSVKKMHLKMSSASFWPFCSSSNALEHVCNMFSPPPLFLWPLKGSASNKFLISKVFLLFYPSGSAYLHWATSHKEEPRWIDSFTVSMHSSNGRHLPAARAVQGDCHACMPLKKVEIPPNALQFADNSVQVRSPVYIWNN